MSMKIRQPSPAAGTSGGRLDRAGRARFRRARRELREELGDLDEVCVCTCIRNAHRHWRRGTDCCQCGKAACPVFRPAPPERPAGQAAESARSKIIFWRNR